MKKAAFQPPFSLRYQYLAVKLLYHRENGREATAHWWFTRNLLLLYHRENGREATA
jgi:hypothetical protein